MKAIADTLAQLGFEGRETLLYTAMLKTGPASIRDIADASGLNRGSTYELLRKMQAKGIVSFHPKGKRKYYTAESPMRLLAMADEKRVEVELASKRLQTDIVPQLMMMQPATSGTDVRYYEGEEGIALVLKDILNSVAAQEDKAYSVYSSKQVREHLYRPFPNYTKQRIKMGIKVRAIAIGEGGENAPLSERKWLKHDNGVASYLAIYPPKVAMFSLSDGDLPSALVVESMPMAATQKILFDTLWSLL